MRVLLHLHIANSLKFLFDTSFADWRNYCCLLYRAEYKYSGFAVGKFGKCEEDSGKSVVCGKVMFLLVTG
jgi:hypothetical protein